MPLLLLPVMMGEISALTGAQPGSDGEFFPFLSTYFVWGVFLGFFALNILVGLIGAGFCLAGREFRYPILGTRLARYVEYQPGTGTDGPAGTLNGEREDRWVAAMSHAVVVLLMWGLTLPLVVWFAEKNNSKFLRFQALQALVYQVMELALYIGATALYMLAVFLMIGAMMVVSAFTDPQTGMVILLIFGFIILLFIAVVLLLMPLLQILGQWAALRILQGRDYEYPLLGRRLRGWLDRPGLEPRRGAS
jgi:uncharacterized Tic20 family protein